MASGNANQSTLALLSIDRIAIVSRRNGHVLRRLIRDYIFPLFVLFDRQDYTYSDKDVATSSARIIFSYFSFPLSRSSCFCLREFEKDN